MDAARKVGAALANRVADSLEQIGRKNKAPVESIEKMFDGNTPKTVKDWRWVIARLHEDAGFRELTYGCQGGEMEALRGYAMEGYQIRMVERKQLFGLRAGR
jgi:hypothetical protein